jgi:uncharacterized repeat protein (TIGR01451 family)
MNRRSLLTVVLVVWCVFAAVALILSVAATANASLFTTPLSNPPAPKFAPFDGLPEQIPPQLRAAYQATTRIGHTPSTIYATPDVLLFKWTPGNQARSGGVMVYSVYYANIGYAEASNVIITDTLPVSTTYAGDTSDLSMTSTGDVITWTIGTLPARTEGSFNVTLNIDPSVSLGSTLADNCARINTATAGDDPGNNEGCAGGVNVVSGDIDISVQTTPVGPFLFDATPGQEYPFNLQVCNFNNTPAGPVYVTDTLPVSTTFSRWQANNFWPRLWNQVSASSTQLVLEAPGLPAFTCDDVRMFVLVDAAAPQGQPLLNRLSGSTPGGTNSGNDFSENDAAHVFVPRIDLSTQRRLSYGAFGIEADINNVGNTAVPALLTDTLPLSATFRSGSGRLQTPTTNMPITPTVIGLRTLVWNLGTLPVAYSAQLHYEMDVAAGAVGPLENCGTIGSNVPDDAPWNNTACVEAAALSAGAHLQIAKQHEWQNNYNQLRYELRVTNTGDQMLSGVWLTDTYPLYTTMQNGYNTASTSQITDTWNAPNQRIFWIEQIQPGELVRIWVNVNPDDPNARPRTYTNTLVIDQPAPATVTDVTTLDEFTAIDLRVSNPQIEAWGNAVPGATVRVTTASDSGTTPVDGNGNWYLNQSGAINAGDTVTVELEGSAEGPIVLHVPVPFDVAARSTTRQIYGHIDTLDQELLDLQVYGYIDTNVQTDGSGYFTRTLPMMERGQQGEVIHRVQDDALTVAYHANFASPDLLLTVNPTHDWIELNYEVGHTLWLTVTDALGNVKATLTDVTQIVPWWCCNTGYSTNMGTWLPGQPDIVAGDWVSGALDNGFTSTLKIGTITGVLDQPNATITGTVSAPWLNALLKSSCWIDNVPGNVDFTLSSNGGAYTCNFSPAIFRPGDTISVQYDEPARNQVRYVFRVPGPDVSINLWTQGQPAAGSRYQYWLEYRNDGDLPATNVVLTDTLPPEVMYVSDGAPVAPTVTGNLVVWSLGTLPVGATRRIPLVVEVTPGTPVGTPLHNVAEVTDPDDHDTNNNMRSRDDNVAALDVDLNVGVWNQGSQPAPGNDYVYRIDYGNQGGTGSGPVLLTQTLPVSSTYVTFWSEDPVWTLAGSVSNQLVFTRSTISGWSGAQLFVRLRLDVAVSIGTQLDTQVDISTSNENGSLGNSSASQTQLVQDPRLDVALNNQFESGITVADYAVTFRLDYHNWGNLPGTNTRITSTLPAGTTFITSTQQVFAYNQWQNEPFAPLSISGQQVVWDLDTLPTGTDGQLRVTLHVDPATSIGTVLTNTARIDADGVDTDERNNEASDSITVRGAGPNLLVRKNGRWESDDRIRYDLQFYNVGTTSVSGVVVTDTYPVSTTLNNGNLYWNNASTNDAGARQIVWTVTDRIDAGNNGGGWVVVNVDPAIVKGLWLTNTLEINQPIGEVAPEDNIAYAVVTTGPELYVTKTADRATVKPNEVVTFILNVGNAAQRNADNTQGSVIVTDTLPNGVSFMGAYWHGCVYCVPPQSLNGQQLVLDLGSMPNNWWGQLDVVMRITTTAQAGEVFFNHASISSDNLADVDPIASNNVASAQVLLTNPAFEVSKIRSGNGVAGTVITYALNLSNTGNLTGTNVTVIDVVPSGVTYGGGGAYASGQVSWTVPSSAPGASGAIGWFSGTLTCAANTTINNQQYRVIGSDQAVTSTNGAAVSFTTIKPTINVAFTNAPVTLIGSGPVVFTGTASTDGTSLAYAWAFGDGVTGTGLNASHTYTQPGVYTATLTATDGCGFMQSTTVNSAVIVYTPAHAAFASSLVSGIAPVMAIFTNTSTGDFSSSLWDFGDGMTSTLSSSTHTYASAGVYTVALTVTGLGGTDTHTVTNAVTVYAPVHAAFTATPASGTPPLTVIFTNTSTGTFTSSLWSFGDGLTSTLACPTHVYSVVGTYTVTLTVSGPGGMDALNVSNAVTVQKYRVMLPMVLRP